MDADTYLFLKPAHITLAIASGTGFALRAWWMLRSPGRLERTWIRTFPHLLDTLLLASGLWLAVGLSLSPLLVPWFGAKLGMLVVYIVAGSLALRRAPTRKGRLIALGVAAAAYASIIALATLRPLPF